MQSGLLLVLGHFADHLDELELLLMAAVREVEAGDVQAGAHELTEGDFVARCRTQGGDNFGTTIVYISGRRSISNRQHL